MANIGSLVVSLEANIAKFSTDMKSAAETTQKTMKGIQDSVSGVKGELLSLASTFVSVGAVVASVKSAISLGDELKQMSDATGIAIAKLDQLAIVAKLNGASLETVANSTKFLTRSMIEAQDSTSKTGQLFAALGVAVKDASGNLRGSEAVMGDVAEALNSIENETTRAAVGTAIFGKSYLAIAATLRNFKEDQQKANEVLEKFGSVSDIAANLSDELTDKFTLLGEGSKRALLNSLVPGMAAAGQAIQELINQGGAFQTGFGDVISSVSTFVSQAIIGMTGVFKIAGTTIAAVMASIATRSLEPLRELPAELAKIDAEVSGQLARIRTAAQFKGLDDSDQISRAAAATDRLNKTKADSVRLNGLLSESGKKTRQSVADYTADIQKLNDEMVKMDGGDGGYSHLFAANEKYQADLRANKDINLEQVRVLMQTAIAADEQAIATKKLAAAWKEAEDTVRKAIKDQEDIDDAILKANLTIKEQNDALKLEHATLGFTDNARAQFVTRLKLEEAQMKGNTNAVILLTEKLQLLQQQARDEAFATSVKAWGQALESASSGLADFFTDLVDNGTSAFKRLWDNFKHWALQAIAEIAAKQIVVSIVGALGVGGAAGAQAAGGLLGTGGSGLLGTLLNSGGGGGISGIGQLLGLGTSGPSFLQGFGNLSLGVSDFTQLLGQGIGITQAASTAFAGLGSSLTAVLGPIGLFVGGLSLLSGFLNKGGGPQTRDFGTSGADISSFGDFSSLHKLVGTDAATSSQLSAFALGQQTTYNTILKALGGSGSAQFALYTSQDPRGTASNQLDVRATVGGSLAYSANIQDQLGRDPAILEERLKLEASRAILGALQVSDFPKDIADLFKSLDASTATQEQIDNVTKSALALQQAVVDVAAAADEAAQALVKSLDSLRSAKQAYTGIDTSAQDNQAKLNDLLTTFIADRPWAQGLGSDTLVGSLSQILESDFAQYSAADQALIVQIINLAATIKNSSAQIADSNQAVVDANQAAVASYNALEQRANTEAAAIARQAASGTSLGQQRAGFFGTLAGQGGGDFGEQIAIQIQYITSEIAKLQAIKPNAKVAAEIKALQDTGVSLAQTLTYFADLKTRYGPQAAEQLVKLTETYKSQVKQLEGNAVALDLLHTSFESQWNAIISGTATGVGGVQDQLKKLQQSILDYVDSLRISDISPLTPAQKLAEARRQYESDLAKATTGDQTALGDITGSADAFLKLARDFYASSSSYTSIFDMVTGQLTTLGTADLSAVTPPMNAADQALLDALPVGSKLMSAADLQAIIAFGGGASPTPPGEIAAAPKGWSQWWGAKFGKPSSSDGSGSDGGLVVPDLMTSWLMAHNASSDKIADKVDQSKHAIVEALTVGRK